jgi:hypothetical protein
VNTQKKFNSSVMMTMGVVPLLAILGISPNAADFAISVDWASSLRTVTTAATVEVDVMPHLARVPEGGSFSGYFSAVSNLGARFVRFSPWYAYPRAIVAELSRPDCQNAKGSSWNTTHLDQIVADFMLAVCGPNAADGQCDNGLSVVPQLSTMPDWLFQPDGANRTSEMPADPWQYPSDKFGYYVVGGKPLIDGTCEEIFALSHIRRTLICSLSDAPSLPSSLTGVMARAITFCRGDLRR